MDAVNYRSLNGLVMTLIKYPVTIKDSALIKFFEYEAIALRGSGGMILQENSTLFLHHRGLPSFVSISRIAL